MESRQARFAPAAGFRWMAGVGLAAYAQMLNRTARFICQGESNLDSALAAGRPVMLASWHGQAHMILPYLISKIDVRRAVVMVVGDARGEVLASFTRKIGGRPLAISGEDQSMGSPRRLLQLVRDLRRMGLAYIHPDGPDGPARVAKPGVAFVAAMVEALVVPIGAWTPSCYHLRRWDRYALPLPYSRIHLVFGESVAFNRQVERMDALQKLSRAMDLAQDWAAGG
jgi:lysophospholipid acyltransferase (LPLAT)-like uncharacterized protein